MIPGTILFDDEFKFTDGSVGKKILIILNDGNPGFYIIVKTTSRSAYKSAENGCQLSNRYPNFFLPKGSCCLNEDTWIQLDQYFEFTAHELVSRHFTGQIKIIGILPKEIIYQLLDCAIKSDDISLSQEKVLKEILKNLEK
jgi:hypothetical protein